MNGLRAFFVCLAVVCASLTAPAATAAPSAATGASPPTAAARQWEALPVPPVTAGDADVADLAARAPDDAWATGYEQTADGPRPLLYRWDGRTWSRDTTFPGAGEPGYLRKIQFVGDEVWIFRNRGEAGEILRWSAGAWSTVVVPQTLWWYQDFTAVPGAAWVVGEDANGPHVLHYDGARWTAQTPPAGVLAFNVIEARSAGDAWAEVSRTDGGSEILRWDGTAWRDVRVPLPSGGRVHRILLDTSGRVTLGGRADADGVPRPFLTTWNGHAWRTTYPPLGDNYFYGLERGPDGALWLPLVSNRAFQSKYARIDGNRTTFSYGPERPGAIEVQPRAVASAGASLLAFGIVEIYGSKPNLMSERLGG
ncbi:hypothetical protein H9Y04_21855 [Streptomyces sp. TRM66268-LWL]|uniref:Secreted protein n=1 Tax=Streptomyces polyasparticus TaxID=2767826 RepID=A0ABR7SI58_9ACTN|nr:hypothetical protein [Streptomyces polyasparticus]MBC9715200.1 hypothetical protein [Streptomyces polyasparticus]